MEVTYVFILVLHLAVSEAAIGQSIPVSNGSTAETCNFTSPLFKGEIMEQVQELFKKEVLRQRYLGESREYAAMSCDELKEIKPCLQAGEYWIETDYGASSRYCSFESKSWYKIADVNMQVDTQCPNGLEVFVETGSGKRLCRRPEYNGGCSSVVFSISGKEYSQVRGRLVGYQYYSMNGFYSSQTVESVYVDGVSITHGHPRSHIWTFAVEGDEPYIGSSCNARDAPPFVGNNYYYDTGSHERFTNRYYIENPLWDGEGCGPTSTCCDNPDLPWFTKELDQLTHDDIELRACRNSDRNNEDILLEIIELYVK